MDSTPSITAALLAALLFGASTPFAKQLAGDISPIMLAGLLYLGSGIGLWALRLVRDGGLAVPRLPAKDWVWLLGARSEERRVGKECVSTCRSRWSPYH